MDVEDIIDNDQKYSSHNHLANRFTDFTLWFLVIPKVNLGTQYSDSNAAMAGVTFRLCGASIFLCSALPTEIDV
jgi:hypothetical protein